jgi:serine/threonine-protein kinase
VANALAMTMAGGQAVGSVLADRYELRAHLGTGGMGSVYRAFDRELDEEVALKVLHVDLAVSGDGLVRFRREVKLARRVTHPCVARTFDLGVHPGMRFLTMELIAGESLRARAMPLALPEALRIASEVGRGLAAAHAQGVTHRDLKPDNVMLAGDRVVVTDFGIARAEGDAAVTHGGIVGTPAYMAPEQVEARPIDGRADVFALGVVLYEMLTGQLPFMGDTPLAMALARLTTAAPDPRMVRRDLPDGVAALVRSMLMRASGSRPDAQTATDRIDALRGFGGEASVPVRSTPSTSGRVETPGALGVAGTVSIDPFAADDDAHSKLAASLARAIGDALGREPRVRVVAAGTGDLVISGDVRVSGDRARVRLRLASRAAVTLFAGHVDGTLADPFGLEDAVAAQALDQVKKRVATSRRVPASPELRARWDEAMAMGAGGDHAAMRKSIATLEALHDEAPTDPVVNAGLALAMMRMVMARGEADASATARAEELALRARDADPSLGESYHAIGMVRAMYGDWRGAYAATREALARNPSLADTQVDFARILLQCGHLSEAVARIELGLRLGPTATVPARVLLVRALALSGQLDRAREELAGLRTRLMPTSLAEIEARTALWFGEREQLIATCEAMSQRGGLWVAAADVVARYARGESVTNALDALDAGLRDPRITVRHTQYFGTLAVELGALTGSIERALDLLEQLAEWSWFVELSWFDHTPGLDALRTSPRGAAVRARMAIRAADVFAG